MTDIAVREAGAAIAEQVIVKGDLAKLTEAERMAYYGEVCRSLGLNPLTRPFEYITLNGKLTLYATRGAADQLRASRGISIGTLTTNQVGDLYVVVATGRDGSGREDSATGAVAIKGLSGEALANAMMKAETKAKRRLTLSLAGLGWPDETEVETIPGAVRVAAPTLAERVEARRAELAPPVEPEPAPEPLSDEEVAAVDAAYVDVTAPEPPAEPAMARGMFNRRAVQAGLAKLAVEEAAAALNLPGPSERTAQDYAALAAYLGIA